MWIITNVELPDVPDEELQDKMEGERILLLD